MFNIAGLLGLAVGLCIAFLPSILAVLRGNINKGQVIKYQLIILVITILVSVVVSFIGVTSVKTGFQQNEMTQAAVDMTEQAAPEATAPEATAPEANGVAAGSRILTIICAIGGGIWALISIVLWFYLLIHALRDQEITLLSRFGINI